jgi:hypothetical protein
MPWAAAIRHGAAQEACGVGRILDAKLARGESDDTLLLACDGSHDDIVSVGDQKGWDERSTWRFSAFPTDLWLALSLSGSLWSRRRKWIECDERLSSSFFRSSARHRGPIRTPQPLHFRDGRLSCADAVDVHDWKGWIGK